MKTIKTNVKSYEECHTVLNRYQHFFMQHTKTKAWDKTYSLYRVDFVKAEFKIPKFTNKTIMLLNSFGWKYFVGNNK